MIHKWVVILYFVFPVTTKTTACLFSQIMPFNDKHNLAIWHYKKRGPKRLQVPRNRLKRELILDWKTTECTCVWYSESGLSSASSLDRPKSDTLHDMFSPTRTLRAARSLMEQKKRKTLHESKGLALTEPYSLREALETELHTDVSKYNIVCDEKHELVLEKLVLRCS